MNGGEVKAAAFIELGRNAGSKGTAIVNGSKVTAGSQFVVGDLGVGDVQIINHSTVTAALGVISANAAAGPSTATVDGSTWNNTGSLLAGYKGNGTLTIQNEGFVKDADGFIGLNAGSNGTVNVTGANSKWTNTARLFVGGGTSLPGGFGKLNISNSATVSVGTTMKIWGFGHVDFSDPNSQIVVAGGAGPLPTVGGLYVGSSTTVGTIEIVARGRLNINPNVPIARVDGLAGTLVTVTGDETVLQLPRKLEIGSQNSGELKITDGALVSVSAAPVRGTVDATLGVGDNSTGIITVEGTVPGHPERRSIFFATSMIVGDQGVGQLNVKSGAKVVTETTAVVGNWASLTGGGAVTVDASEWFVVQQLVVGDFGDGELEIKNGGKVFVGNSSAPDASQMYIGRNPPEASIVTVDGTNSELKVYGDLTVAEKGYATLHIKNGGHVENNEAIVGYNTGSNGTVIVDNASWLCLNDLTVGLLGTGVLEMRNGGVVGATGTVRIGAHGIFKGTGAVTGTGLTVLVEGVVARCFARHAERPRQLHAGLIGTAAN